MSLTKIFLLLTITTLTKSKTQKSKKTIYIIRHGETDLNVDPIPRIRGRINNPLNKEGIAHAKAAGDFLSEIPIGKIYYSSIPRAYQTAQNIASQHKEKVTLIEEPDVIDISWGDWEGKTFMECFGREDGGDFFKNPQNLIIPNGETFYGVMARLRHFFIKFWESDENICTIVSHGAVTNVMALMFIGAPLEKFWTMYMAGCGVSKVYMKGINHFEIAYWNMHHFLKDGERKYIK